jgi:hypothetical protein
MATPSIRDDELRQEAQESMSDIERIRERVRNLTLQALRDRKFDAKEFQNVMSALTQGISLGAEKHGENIKGALSAAFTGLDEAFTRAAHASSLAVKELAARGKEFSEAELKQSLIQMRRMETDFTETWSEVARSASGAVKTEMQDLIIHVQRTGTDTSKVVGDTVREFTHRMGSTWMSAQTGGIEAARTLGNRFAQAASGLFAAMSEALNRDEPRKPK